MAHLQHCLSIKTNGKSFRNITANVRDLVRQSSISVGVCNLFLCHTSASLVIQENADPDVLRDLETFFAKLVPENPALYRHTMEGPDDMPAHIRTALTRNSETIPIQRGQLCLGTWQAIYVWEHRDRGSEREIVVHISGE